MSNKSISEQSTTLTRVLHSGRARRYDYVALQDTKFLYGSGHFPLCLHQREMLCSECDDTSRLHVLTPRW
jgi:hypothetical protein